MKKDLIINSTPTEVELALLEDDLLVEIHHQKTNSNFSVGDIFLGKIIKTMPGLNAAFVDIGHKKEAFLHYTDLGPKLRSLIKFANGAISGGQTTASLEKFKVEADISKSGKIDQVLTRRDAVLVQILKEPISTKGPRLSCEVTLPGRYMVLSPFSNTVSISKKIANEEERQRLARLIESIRPKNFGVIVRTAAEGKKVVDLHEEIKELMEKWEQIFSQMHNVQPPKKLLSELDKTTGILRDILSVSFNQIVVNDKELFLNIRTYLQQFAPEQVNILSMYSGSRSVFDQYGISKQIKSSFGKTATMSSGAYLIVEHTEAMHVIDVNSGPKMSATDTEGSALSVNLEAAKEIARQIRLRDIGGLIVVDFIDMKNPEHKKKLHEVMTAEMKSDRAQHTILPLSKFGLMQITRERVRPEIKKDASEICPTCNGTGKVNASILLTDDIQRDLDFILQSQPELKPALIVHPYIEAFLKKGFFKSLQASWFFKYRKWIKISSNNDYQLMEYRFFDKNNDEIRLN